MRKVNLPEDIESPRDDFLTHELVELFAAQAATKRETDWNQLGETLKEKYFDLVYKINETTNEIIKAGGKGYFWLVASIEMANLFEADLGFLPGPFEQLPLGYSYVLWLGCLNKKWRVYLDPLVPKGRILIGAGFSKKRSAFYGTLDVKNFKE